ncbi:unnamed protein product [Ixodes persulcatus]
MLDIVHFLDCLLDLQACLPATDVTTLKSAGTFACWFWHDLTSEFRDTK